jgi:tRNA pseudouridine55 synthase
MQFCTAKGNKLNSEYGVILINKPVGITSFRVVQILRRITGIKKIGHTGTLDPFASGLLPVCIGKATRMVNLLSGKDKTYKAKINFGEKTDTGDIEGKIIETKDSPDISEASFAIFANEMLNIKEQIPPKYSAKKVNGQRAYKLARTEQDFELKPVPVNVSKFKITELDLPTLSYISTVSKGTYIRTLSETFAEKCGSNATTIELIRTQIGNLKIQDSVELDALTKENWKEHLIDLKDIFTSFPTAVVKSTDLEKFRNGNETLTNADDAEQVIILSEENTCIGFGRVSGKVVKVKHMFL